MSSDIGTPRYFNVVFELRAVWQILLDQGPCGGRAQKRRRVKKFHSSLAMNIDCRTSDLIAKKQVRPAWAKQLDAPSAFPLACEEQAVFG